MASENCQILLKIMTVSSLTVQILKKELKRIRLVFPGKKIFYLIIQKSTMKGIIKGHI